MEGCFQIKISDGEVVFNDPDKMNRQLCESCLKGLAFCKEKRKYINLLSKKIIKGPTFCKMNGQLCVY